MIEPKNINISQLPSLVISQLKLLPRSPGIYFVLDSEENLLYIGRSINLRQRWHGHHQKPNVAMIHGIHVAWLEVKNSQNLNSIESALIAWFQPPLNRESSNYIYSKSKRQDTSNRYQIKESGQVFTKKGGGRVKGKPMNDYGEMKVKTSFSITQSALNRLEEKASQLEVSRSELLERIGRKYLVQVSFESATGLDAIAQSMNISRSELLEQIGRGLLEVRPSRKNNSQ